MSRGRAVFAIASIPPLEGQIIDIDNGRQPDSIPGLTRARTAPSSDLHVATDAYAQDAQEIGIAGEDLRRLRPVLRLAQEMGEGLGAGEVLRRALQIGREETARFMTALRDVAK